MGAQWRIINQNYKNLEGKWEGRATILHIHTLLGAGADSTRPTMGECRAEGSREEGSKGGNSN